MHPFIYHSIHLSIQPANQSMIQQNIHLSYRIHISIHQSTNPSPTKLSIHQSLKPSNKPDIIPSIHLSLHPPSQSMIQTSFHPFVYPSIHPANQWSRHHSIHSSIPPSTQPINDPDIIISIHLSLHPPSQSMIQPTKYPFKLSIHLSIQTIKYLSIYPSIYSGRQPTNNLTDQTPSFPSSILPSINLSIYHPTLTLFAALLWSSQNGQNRCWTTCRCLCAEQNTCHRSVEESVPLLKPLSLWLYHTHRFHRCTGNCNSSDGRICWMYKGANSWYFKYLCTWIKYNA